MPRTRAGRWSLRLLGVSLIFFAAFYSLVATGQRGGDTFFGNPWLSGTILPAGGAAVAAATVGLVGVIKQQERSPAVYIAVVLGLLVLAFGIAEVVAPH